MIQRIQTVYLALVIIIVGWVAVGIEIFSFTNKEASYELTSFGFQKFVDGNFETSAMTIPLIGAFAAIIIMAFLTIMSYKNLSKQFRLGRMTFGLYFITLLTVVLLNVFGESVLGLESLKSELGLGFFLLCAGFPFSFLANIGIKRDKSLLSSLDRLR